MILVALSFLPTGWVEAASFSSIQIVPLMGDPVVESVVQIDALAVDATGWSISPQPTFNWASSDTAVGTIDGTGLFAAVALGTTTITATEPVSGLSGTILVTVITPTVTVTPVLTSISITQFPVNETLQVGRSWGLEAVALDQTGAIFFPTPTITWTSSDTAVATISVTPNSQGFYILTAKGPGTTTITAFGGGINKSSVLTVVNKPACGTSVSFSPGSTSIILGNTLQLTASVVDQYGAIMPSAAIYWLNSSPGVASVVNGLVTGIIPGQTSINSFTDGCFGIIYGNAAVITVLPVPGTFSITASAGAGGTINPTGYKGVVSGGTQAYAITPNTNYHVVDVLVDNISVGPVTTYSFSNVTADHTIVAAFALNTSGVTSSAGSGGTISPLGNVPIIFGNSQTFTITPNVNYHVADVLVDAVSVGPITNYTFSNVTTGHTIAATFAINTNNITATVGAGGTISPLGAIAVPYGSNQVYIITPNSGFQIFDIQVDGVSIGAVANYTFINVTAPHTINATFSAATTFNLVASAGLNGSINPIGTTTVISGASQSFTITPNAGYHVLDVLIDNVSTGAVTSYTFTNIAANHTIDATFALNSGTINIVATTGAGGTITPAGATTITSGANQIYTVTPNVGYSVLDVLVDNVSIGAVTSYVFTNVTSSHTISATFAINTFNLAATANVGGTIAPVGTTFVNYGASQTYNILPNIGYQISDVLIDGVSVGAVAAYTFTNVTARHTIVAVFSLLPPVTLNLNPGWNLVTLPLQAIDLATGLPISYTADSFGVLAGADVVAQWSGVTQKYSSHIVGLPVGDFSLTNGLGFFVHVTTARTLNFTGSSFTPLTPILNIGWNLVGFNNSASTTAAAFGAGFTGVDVVAKYNSATQTWTSHIMSLPVNNFNLNQGDGIFVHLP